MTGLPDRDARSGLWLGVLAAFAANTIWGLNPLYFGLLDHVPAPELLAHRIFWGGVFAVVFCLASGRVGSVAGVFRSPCALAGLAVTAMLVTLNWLVYLFAIQSERVTEAGFGFYLMPLVAVTLGVVLLGERLGRLRWAAVALAALAVAGLAVSQESVPVASLVIAISFGTYGLLRKRMATGAITGFAVEALLLTPFALGWLLLVHDSRGGAFGADAGDTALLILSGPITGLPLILFAEAARRLAYSTVGILQYINPTLQIGCALLLLGEPVTPALVLALGLIWAALALYSLSLVRPGQPPEPPGPRSAAS
ncbi:MAG: EamA family transporter RarD [Pseudomonadota bacterium]